jgi:hypothetical protein
MLVRQALGSAGRQPHREEEAGMTIDPKTTTTVVLIEYQISLPKAALCTARWKR